jgi:O-antigen/teichoic acid export membrane protein
MDDASLFSAVSIQRLRTVRKSQNVDRSVRNAAYSLADYVAQPVAMLVAAPFLVHHLGLQQYGLWMLVSTILGGAGTLSTGFGDATLKYVSAYRARKDCAGVERTIRATLSINIVLGCSIGGLVYVLAPLLTHAVKIEPGLQLPATRAVQISAAVLICRSIESVFISALRAVEHYGPAVKLNISLRLTVIGSAVLLAAMGRGVADIMAATLFWSVVVLILQAAAARSVAGPFKLLPSLRAQTITEVFAFGSFSWLQALAGVVFAYADRFLVGILLGAGPIAIYVLCVQAAQSIHGICAALFNFLLPHLSSRCESGEFRASRQVFHWAVWANVVIAAGLALPLILGGRSLLTVWMGSQFAIQGRLSLALLSAAYALVALNVVPHYSLLAMGDVKYVSGMNILGGALSLCAAAILIPYIGLPGAALGRVVYGSVTILLLVRARRRWPRPIAVNEEAIPLFG